MTAGLSSGLRARIGGTTLGAARLHRPALIDTAERVKHLTPSVVEAARTRGRTGAANSLRRAGALSHQFVRARPITVTARLGRLRARIRCAALSTHGFHEATLIGTA